MRVELYNAGFRPLSGISLFEFNWDDETDDYFRLSFRPLSGISLFEFGKPRRY